ncbi:hypothetical protein EJ02DRAFT_75915 [Clathrospora elynae]|uniref:Uncharacterized protein n=1 Tax=Clathrospora elynae TaxID=706981 RepID=A0A6A5SAP8_9PLEO|nr:hypothetical protein EJ02DRAFT_75915 [Clathrospora elynae]
MMLSLRANAKSHHLMRSPLFLINEPRSATEVISTVRGNSRSERRSTAAGMSTTREILKNERRSTAAGMSTTREILKNERRSTAAGMSTTREILKNERRSIAAGGLPCKLLSRRSSMRSFPCLNFRQLAPLVSV